MSTIDLTQNNDGRLIDFEGYDHNRRMGTFTGSWGDSTKTGGQNTWSHLGVYCGQHLGPDVPDTEQRLIYLGLLIAYINGDWDKGVYTASSRHPTIVNVCLADGSVRQVGNDIELSTWMSLGTRDGRDAIGEF